MTCLVYIYTQVATVFDIKALYRSILLLCDLAHVGWKSWSESVWEIRQAPAIWVER